MKYFPLIFPILLKICSAFGSESLEYKDKFIEIRTESNDLTEPKLLMNTAFTNLVIEIEKERVSKLALIDD